MEGVATFNQYVSPWVTLVDDRRYQATVDRVADLAPEAIVGCHTPVISGERIATAVDVTRRAPQLTVAPQPDQAVLDEIQHALGAGITAA